MSTSREKAFDFDVSRWAALPRLRGLFVTGTDTGVGKTLVGGAIARYFRRRGHRVEVFKPVATGCRRFRGQLVSEDAEFLAGCADSARTLAEICPVRFRLPVAPNVAARRAKTAVDLEAIFEAYRRLRDAADVVIVEGAGGLMCPITERLWVIHLARMMALPVVIVARPGLGTINHTLLTIHAARSAGLDVAGVVINRYVVEAPAAAPVDPEVAALKQDLSPLSNPQQIADLAGVEILAIVPEEKGNSVQLGTIGPDTQFSIAQGPWERIADRGLRNEE